MIVHGIPSQPRFLGVAHIVGKFPQEKEKRDLSPVIAAKKLLNERIEALPSTVQLSFIAREGRYLNLDVETITVEEDTGRIQLKVEREGNAPLEAMERIIPLKPFLQPNGEIRPNGALEMWQLLLREAKAWIEALKPRYVPYIEAL